MTIAHSNMQNFIRVFSQLSPHNLDTLYQVYDANLTFIDPAHNITGLDSFHDYMVKLYAPLTECYFDIHDSAAFGDIGFISWTLNFTHPNFNQGRKVVVEGCSKVKWYNDKIVYHRDYFDLGAMLYEKLPLLGKIIHFIKNKLGSN
ncbi:nuclear transport factor 2 family protein [Paraferrimonas sp. SM1919]|uniref:nuclear transport factor 2 family protein n=1 Tax=Paraferrimonas sp. SM1919 TaxID=2662263 RepID=UPI0013D1FFD5|nr:nuclear transport factor 2 family protein [Paraferrimonas sp. SM1919]